MVGANGSSWSSTPDRSKRIFCHGKTGNGYSPIDEQTGELTINAMGGQDEPSVDPVFNAPSSENIVIEVKECSKKL